MVHKSGASDIIDMIAGIKTQRILNRSKNRESLKNNESIKGSVDMTNQRQKQKDENYVENFKNCLEKEKPFCQAACPFHIDISGFIDKMKRGAYKAAYKTYRDATGFPGIVSRLCHEPCKAVCPRKTTDSAIELMLLERAAVEYADDTNPTAYNLPRRNKKIAVIGGGISGLACALRLAAKKFDVTIYEKSGRIGGELWNVLPDGGFTAEIEHQLQHEEYTLRLNTEIKTLEDLGEVDAVYIATGRGGNDFDMGRSHPDGIFTGGMLLGKNLIEALADGLNTATAIDNLLKTGRALYPEDKRATGTILAPSLLYEVTPTKGSLPGGGYTREEAVAEAERCIQCKCSACYLNCDLIQYTNKWPLRMRDEIAATTLPGWSEVKATPAKRLLNTCNQCGICVDVCPKEIDLERLFLDGRRSMHRQDKTPWVFYDFWIRDMDFADGEHCAIRRMPKGMKEGVDKSRYAFFPGCQLGASRPKLVEQVYGYLAEKLPDTGLILQCCGAPAEWAGIVEKHQESIDSIRSTWESMGRPVLVLACPTCGRKFNDYLPEIPTIFIYELMEQLGYTADPEKIRVLLGGEMIDGGLSIFDPCASRQMPALQESVRKYAGEIGCKLEPLPQNGPNANCCGYGGQPGITDPAYEKFVRERRIAEGDKPYITYCVNCRDAFLDAGKPAVHLLDILFPQDEDPSKDLYHLPTVTERRQYREELKKKLLKKYWGEEMNEEMNQEMNQGGAMELVMEEELRQKISRERILEEDIKEVIEFCQRTRRRVFNEEAGTYSGYRQIGHMTYWVEYIPETPNRIRLVNAYSHRMKIELEAVWNGRKVETDL